MSIRTDFVKQYTALPDSKGVRGIVFGMWLMINYVDAINIYGLEIKILRHTFWELSAYWAVLLFFDLLGLAFVISPKKLSKYIYLYTASVFAGTSLYLLYASNVMVYLDSGVKAILFLTMSLIIYSLVIVAMVKNISNKMRKGISHVINTKNSFAVATACGALGIMLAKLDFIRGNFHLAVASFILSCCFALPCSGFHKFYLINKMSKEDNTQNNKDTQGQDG